MGKAYTDELSQLPETAQWAISQPVEALRRAVQLYSDRGLLAIGSGGSFTAAAFASEMHFRVWGRPSQAMTPLGVAHLPAAASMNAAGLLLSAEGKNHDILLAAQRLLLHGCPAIGLTLRSESPLSEFCNATGAATLASYDMPWGKDGYLATNSLIATLILLWRAYTPESEDGETVAALQKLLEWHAEFSTNLAAGALGPAHGKRALILHGTAGRIGAIDLESKLTEGALAFGQVCDFRQFAHGRHLQLNHPDEPIALVSFGIEGDPLADATHRLLPASARPLVNVMLPALGFPAQEIAGVLAAFALTRAWAGEEIDPGQPDVPQFGRDLHGLEMASLVSESLPINPVIARKQSGRNEPAAVLRRAHDYFSRLKTARFRALICDFDGTFCDTAKRFDGLDHQLALELTRLARGGMCVAFATGRGRKLANILREKLPQDVWPRITVGCYSGSYIFGLDQDDVAAPVSDSRLDDLATWLSESRVLAEPIKPIVDGGQLGVRCVSNADKWRLIAATNEWLAVRGYRGWRTFSSGHSVDVVTENAGKRRVVEQVCRRLELDPFTQVLRLGDAGDFGGNDYELLSEGLSLSVDTVSPDAAQCWNLLPRTLRGARGAQYYLQALETVAGEAYFSATFLESAAAVMQDELSSH
jgi:fructoselysine-6-P-deglycase FrlB-like protein/hydroxymethylpyrimidine pyrophosphatase-like HAD family hydrolase